MIMHIAREYQRTAATIQEQSLGATYVISAPKVAVSEEDDYQRYIDGQAMT